MANAQKVANIFELASAAFKKMADLTIDLKIFQTQAEQGPTTSSRWTIIEVEALKEAVARFGNDLNKIASMIETKTITQIKHKLKNQALEGPTSEPPEGEENDMDIKEMEEFGDNDMGVTELPPVSTVSVDRGRRKQTFSERNDTEAPEMKKIRLDSTPAVTVVRPSAPIVVRPSMPFQRLPPGVPPSSSAPIRPRMATPSASAILSHAHMRKQAAPQPPPSESKYEDYSDYDVDDAYEDVHDDDDDDVSDDPYYSDEEEEGHDDKGSPDD